MLLRDPARPAPGKHILQRLRLSDTGKRIAENGLDEFKRAEGNFSVRLDPITKILTELQMKYGFPVNVARQVPSPGAASPEAPVCPSAPRPGARR